jgi:hypothetical protein
MGIFWGQKYFFCLHGKNLVLKTLPTTLLLNVLCQKKSSRTFGKKKGKPLLTQLVLIVKKKQVELFLFSTTGAKKQ